MSDQNLIELNVEGMTCTNCAATVRRKLEKDGMADINVDFASGEVTFKNPTELTVEQITERIDDLGYKVVSNNTNEKKNS
ncbi:MAG: heavy metal-associated domain-containing protein [Bacteroidota bacterium]